MAKTVIGLNQSEYNSVIADSSGNVYAVGYIYGTNTFDFGDSITAAGKFSRENIILVKYDSTGVAQWAKTVSVGSNISDFYSVAVDSNGNVYAVGEINGTGIYNFGNSITASGKYSVENIIIVKYNSSGITQWAKTVSVGPDYSSFKSVAVDNIGNVYAAGYINGISTFDFGNSVTATGKYSQENIVLVKYDSSGATQWAKTVSEGPDYSSFASVAVDKNNNVYAAGYVRVGTFNFGNNITVIGTSDFGNILLIKYNSSGTAQWANTVSVGSANSSSFYSLVVDNNDNIYAAGNIGNAAIYDFGNNVTAKGVIDCSTILFVKYDSSGIAQWANTVFAASSYSSFNSVAVDNNSNIFAAGYINGTETFDFGDGVTAKGSYNSYNVVLVKYH